MATLKGLTVWRIAHGLGCVEPTSSSACSMVSSCHAEQLCSQQADRQRVCLSSLRSFQAHLCERTETQPAPRLGAQSWVMGCCLLTRRFQPSYWGILLRSCWQCLKKRWWGAPHRQRSWKDWGHPRPDGGGQAWLAVLRRAYVQCKREQWACSAPNSHGPFWRASGPSVTGLLVNCHTDFVTHGQIIWHFRFLSLANATALLALVAKKLSETISSWLKLPYGISSWHQQNKHKSPSGASRYTNEAVSLFMD